jgi:peptidoglycan DL-endopeptidase CwlO
MSVKRSEPPHPRLVTALIAVLALVLALAPPVHAQQPGGPPTEPPNEGGTQTLANLRDNLAAAAAGYIEAEARLDAARAQQTLFESQLTAAEADMVKIRAGVGRYASRAYQTGRLGVIGTMLNANSPNDLMGRMEAMDRITQRDQASLATLTEAKRRATEAKARIDQLVAVQTAAAQEMERRKTAAERALSAVSGGGSSSGRVNVAAAPEANPAPRNPDGSLPKEGCIEDDPTPAPGCITPRTLHSLNEGKRVGFNWYVSCHRDGGDGEHPKGRACDWAAYPNGFVNSSAGGSNRTYGDRVAAFFIKNAKALAVMYVVWYCQIWQVGIGWKRYNSTGSNCGDSPAGDHTNHVHVSIY